MLNRIANVVTFLTFGLLTAILGLGAVAIHDFNNPDLPTGNSKIFIREYERHADYEVGQIEGRLVGFRIDGAFYEPMPEAEVKRLRLSQGIAQNVFELGHSTHRVCQIDFSGLGAASLNFFRAVIE